MLDAISAALKRLGLDAGAVYSAEHTYTVYSSDRIAHFPCLPRTSAAKWTSSQLATLQVSGWTPKAPSDACQAAVPMRGSTGCAAM